MTKKKDPLSEVAIIAGIGLCSFSKAEWFRALQKIQQICDEQSYGVLGAKKAPDRIQLRSKHTSPKYIELDDL